VKIQGWYINLDAATGRNAHMQSEAARLGLPLTRMAAVNGKVLAPDTYQDCHKPVAGMHYMSPPEIACFFSHQNGWKNIAEGDAPYGAVFEDDLVFADDAAALLNDDAWIPEGTDVVKIETTSRKALLLRPFHSVPGERRLGRLGSQHLGGGGYILSKSFAAKLLQETQEFGAPIDYLLFNPDYAAVPTASVLQLFPAICVQQVRTRTKFLPDTAESSGLDEHRKVLKLRGFAKVRRELARPFITLFREISGHVKALLRNGVWKFIHYRG
jgi:glycosyl transferase family 25